MTPLHLTVYPRPAVVDRAAGNIANEGGWAEAARMLLAAGADINARDANGRTPLEFAIVRFDIVERLKFKKLDSVAFSRFDRSELRELFPQTQEQSELLHVLEEAAAAAQPASGDGPPSTSGA